MTQADLNDLLAPLWPYGPMQTPDAACSTHCIEYNHRGSPAMVAGATPSGKSELKEMHMKFRSTAIAILAAMMVFSTCGAVHAANTDKTLVSWVTLSDKNVQAGSVLTVQVGHLFDGIIFSERAAGKWMAGSNGLQRTGKNPNAYAAETADKKTLIQMAIVYKGDHIAIYRDGKEYASYKTRNIDLLSSKKNIVVFGLRHVGGGSGAIGGAIEDARIYSKALSVEEIKSLEPNKASSIKPYAWWDFQGDKIVDRAGRYPHHKLDGGAKLASGKLVLGNNAVLVCAATKAATSISRRSGQPVFTAPHVPETPP